MAAAAAGIVGNQVVARHKRRVGRQINSITLLADAKHSWLDALSSAGALAGLAGVALGLRWADGAAGLVVTAFIVHVGYEVTSDVVVHLTDGVEAQALGEQVQATVSGAVGPRTVFWSPRAMTPG
jgi:divalent metal cation (Fe/Co/Zn/Cd) transporter